MSNDKLSLNFKLKKSDLESKILEKILKNDKGKTSFTRTEDKDNGDTLTELERSKRAAALLNMKSSKANSAQKAPVHKSTQAKPVVTKTPEKQEKSARVVERPRKKKTTTKKNMDGTSNKYSNSQYLKLAVNSDAAAPIKKNRPPFFKPDKRKNVKIIRTIKIMIAMTIHDIAIKTFEIKSKVTEIVQKLDNTIDINQPIDPDIVEIVVQELGHTPKRIHNNSLSKLIAGDDQDDPSMLQERPPVVTIMGHVDHGKTTLIDALRESNIIDTEYGGITQHIGAYQIHTADNHAITVIDTPGHAAFTAMRARGAKLTDIVILVVAADDSIKEQTVEAINHIKAAEVPVIVAINKIDKPEANVNKVTNDLLQHNIMTEEYGGDVLSVPISARNKINLDKLEEAILLQASLLELKANPNKKATGVVLEAELDKKSGVLSTIIVQSGTLRKGDIIVAGSSYCKIKAMIDCHGKPIQEAPPSTPVEVLGFDKVPTNGDTFITVKNEKDAKSIVDLRDRNTPQLDSHKDDIADIFQDDKSCINFIIKSDTQGSIEAILDYINKFTLKEIDVKILHHGVGAITESDILLAEASKAKIIAFCIRENKKLAEIADRHRVSIYHYSIIYELIENIKEILSGFLPTLKDEKSLGSLIVREIFTISKFGKIAGCYVQDGLIKRDARIRLLRDSKLIHEGKVSTLRRFKNDEKEVTNGYECGVTLENYSDLKVNDIIESFEIIETKQTL